MPFLIWYPINYKPPITFLNKRSFPKNLGKMDRDFFKGAIAEAKTVRESAIANAKAALEEAFEPKMRSMLATKLEEMEVEEDATEEVEEYGKMDEKKDETSMDEEINLDEILAELENELSEEDSEEMLKEEEEMETEEEDAEMESDEEEEVDLDDEDVDIEDMTEDELKKFIEDVIEDMVQAGELEAGDSAEEIKDEDEEIEVEDEEEDEEELNELFGLGGKKENPRDEIVNAAREAFEKSDGSDDSKKSIQLDMIKKLRKANLDAGPSEMADIRREIGMEKDERSMMQKIATGASGGRSKVTAEDLSEAVETINILKSELQEINLLNSKLLYSNKIFKAKNLTESQKVKVLNAFDGANTTKEAKLVFETLNNSLTKSKTIVKESRMGSASRSMSNIKPSTKQPIVESNEMVSRFQKLAGIK